MLANYFCREDLGDHHSQSLNISPELIPDENALPLTQTSPTIEVHHITDEMPQNNQPSQDPAVKISETTFLWDQRNDSNTMKIIDSITSIQILNSRQSPVTDIEVSV